MSKSFYNEYEAANSPDAYDLDEEVRNAIVPIIDKYKEKGYTYREIGLMIADRISGAIAEKVIFAAMKKRKKERELK